MYCSRSFPNMAILTTGNDKFGTHRTQNHNLTKQFLENTWTHCSCPALGSVVSNHHPALPVSSSIFARHSATNKFCSVFSTIARHSAVSSSVLDQYSLSSSVNDPSSVLNSSSPNCSVRQLNNTPQVSSGIEAYRSQVWIISEDKFRIISGSWEDSSTSKSF